MKQLIGKSLTLYLGKTVLEDATTMYYKKLAGKVRDSVTRFFANNSDSSLVYHNLEHTKRTVNHAVKIGLHYQLKSLDIFILTAAAWFHDTGYLSAGPIGHEARSAELAKTFLEENWVAEQTVASVVSCIMATSNQVSPETLLEKIMRDADLYHLGTKSFLKQNRLVRKELASSEQKTFTRQQWNQMTIEFLSSHQFETDFCRKSLAKGKERNIKKFRQKLDDHPSQALLAVSPSGVTIRKKGNEKGEKLKQSIAARPDKGVETMFRITCGNQQRLSDMADNKAHIMITANSIIISIMLSVLLRKLEDNPELIAPTLILLCVCLTCMVFAILSTRPSLPGGIFTAEDLESKKVNLLFFGNFYKVGQERYLEAMHGMMNDRDFLYDSLIIDVYAQAEVLGKKYRHLKAAYNIFMFGIIASVIAFIGASMIH